MRLDEEYHLVWSTEVDFIEDCVSWGLERVFLLDHVFHELAQVQFRVYLSTKGPGFFQLACKPISSVERPA